MRLNKRGLAALLALANYVLAVVVSAPVLHHGEHARGLRACLCDSAYTRHQDAKSCGHSPHHAESCAPEDHRGKQCPSRSHDEGTCRICKFLGQKPILADNVVEVTSSPLEQELARVKLTHWVGPIPSTHHIRAPPAIA